MSGDAEVVMTPGDVAKRLGVSPSGLRRLASVYAGLYGELPKDSSGTSRQWPSKAVYRLEQARALMAAGQARSIRDALVAVESGAAPPVGVAVQDARVAEALGVVAARLEALQASNERLEAEVAALRLKVAEVRALPQPEWAAVVDMGQTGGESPNVGRGAAERQPDGAVVRLARWLEQRLRGGKQG
jgi:DNA-binding transcriptional MerR regulator